MIGKRGKVIKMRGGERHNVNKKRDKPKETAVMKTLLSGIHLSLEYIVQFASLSLWKSGLSQAKTKQSHEGIG